MAPPFSTADLYKFGRDVQNDETLICAKLVKIYLVLLKL